MLKYTGNLDFRRGYKRCDQPGVETEIPLHPLLENIGLRPTRVRASFWRKRTGGLFVRFKSSYGYVFCYEALLINGKPVPDEALSDFEDFIMEVLFDWGGTDDSPDETFNGEIDADILSEADTITRKSVRKGGRRL